MIKRIDHVGIAVKDLDQQLRFYTDVLSLKCSDIEEIADQHVKIALFPVGEVKIELLQPTSDNSAIAKFLENKGEGIHHIAYLVTDLEESLKRLEHHEIKVIESKAIVGFGGRRIAFLHPKSTFGVLIELCEQ